MYIHKIIVLGMFIYIYVCVYVYIYMYIYMHMCVCARAYVCIILYPYIQRFRMDSKGRPHPTSPSPPCAQSVRAVQSADAVKMWRPSGEKRADQRMPGGELSPR